MLIQTFPAPLEIENANQHFPSYMRPSSLPYAVALTGALDDNQCDEILRYMFKFPGYEFDHCNAITRQAEHPLNPVFAPAVLQALTTNELYWGFDLDDTPAAWMQTYAQGGYYNVHTDAAPGQTRKLTAVVMLSEHTAYEGGDLKVHVDPHQYFAPATRGSITVFPAWVRHHVTPVRQGVRQTINLGFWGPNFR